MPVNREQIDKVIEIAKLYGATKVLLFGSALEDMDKANDIDIGVLGVPDNRFLDFGGELDIQLGIRVDLAPLDHNSPFVDYIKRKGKFVYES